MFEQFPEESGMRQRPFHNPEASLHIGEHLRGRSQKLRAGKNIFSIFGLIFLCVLSGCGRPQTTQFVSPRTPLPATKFVVTRSVGTTWNAILRALDAHQNVRIASKNSAKRKVILGPTDVVLLTYCDCGRLGKVPLSGRAFREGSVTLRPTAPQETVVHIRIRYWTKYKWKNAQGRLVRTETIPCVSNGRFEKELYKRIRSYLAP